MNRSASWVLGFGLICITGIWLWQTRQSQPVAIAPGRIAAAVVAEPSAACPAAFIKEMTEGPYYKSFSPERADITATSTIGRRMVLTGYVFDKNCKPISGALVDFWQADGNGNYDNRGYNLRGHQFTDSRGKYVLHTVVPGEYPGRTNHIHAKIWPRPEGPIIFTTQLYFPGAPGNSKDEIFSRAALVTLHPSSSTAFFNFKLNME